MINSTQSVKLMFCGLVTLVACSVTGWGDYILTETFDGYTNNQVMAGTYWKTSSDAVVTLSNQTDGVYGHVPLEEAASNNTAGASTDTNVWVDMIAQPLLWDGTNIDRSAGFDTNVAVGFYFWTNRNPVVLDGSSWTEITTHQIDTQIFDRVTAKVNYTTKKWSLFVGGALVKTNISFQPTASPEHYEWISIKDGCDFDGVYVSTNWPKDARANGTNSIPGLTASNDGDAMADAYELQYFDTTSYGDNDDPDGDGFSNYREYKYGSNPNSILDLPPGRILPWAEDFETVSAGTFLTTRGLTPSGNVVVTPNTDVIQGVNKLCMSSGGVHLAVADVNASNVLFSLYLKPVPLNGTAPAALGAGHAVGFCVNEVGALLAYDSSVWFNTDLVPYVPTNKWLQFVAHMDYAASNWNLFVSTSGVYGASSTKLANSVKMGFNVAYSGTGSMQGIAISNTAGAFACADEIALSYGSVAVANGGGTAGYSNNVTVNAALGWSEISVPQFPNGENTMLGALGDVLLSQLTIGDKIRFLLPNGWHTYLVTAPGTATFTGSGGAAEDDPIPPLLGVWIYRSSGDASAAITFTTQEGDQYVEVLQGTLQNAGWNYRAAPAKFGKALTSGTDFGNDAHAQKGDQVWEYVGGVYNKLQRNSDTLSSWLLNNSALLNPPYTLTQPHWYKMINTSTAPQTNLFDRVK